MTDLYTRVGSLPTEVVGGELLIVDAEKDIFFSSNEVGARIWAELAEPVSIDQITQIIIDQFGDSQGASVQADVQEFLWALKDNGLVKRVEAT